MQLIKHSQGQLAAVEEAYAEQRASAEAAEAKRAAELREVQAELRVLRSERECGRWLFRCRATPARVSGSCGGCFEQCFRSTSGVWGAARAFGKTQELCWNAFTPAQ